jgi:alginate O-acetyltransferase complex protein AlgI
MLLMASCYFYMSFIPIYLLILLFTIVIDYYAGICIEKAASKKRKWFLVISLIANVGILAIFKYYNFINENISFIFGLFNKQNNIPYLSIVLPIGLSFHTFQAMSYTIEVYRRNQKAERNFGIYALYVMFYPQLVAGPIERPQNLLYQFYQKHEFEYIRIANGFKLILWGLFKKLVIADRLSIYVDAIYNNPNEHSGLSIIVATVFFAFQIYCDFSGYSEIAIGSAQVMGFKLMTNFKRPYFAKSISEFWKRWHISLSTWFTDYIYISLGGNRVSIPRWYFNLIFVFLLSGLWHGANWTFIIWGGLNGMYLVFALIKNKILKPIEFKNSILKSANSFLNISSTFVLICISWIFFRANSVESAFLLLKNVAKKGNFFFDSTLVYGVFGLLILLVTEYFGEYRNDNKLLFNSNNLWIRKISYAIAIVLIFSIGVLDGGQFIYFQF